MHSFFIFILAVFTAFEVFSTQFPPVEKLKLHNGLEVFFADYGIIQATSFNFYINTGKKNETPGSEAISSITANALLFGNEKWNRLELDDLLEDMGTGINITANRNFTKMEITLLNRDLERGIELMAAVLLKPEFPKIEIEEQIRQMIDFNNSEKMDIGELASVFSDFTVFGTENPLGRHFNPSQLKKITNEKIREFYQFNFTPKNSKLVVAGTGDKTRIKELIEKNFGSWQAAFGETNNAQYDSPIIKQKDFFFIGKEDATQSALRWVKNAPKSNSDEVIAFHLANSVFNDILFKQIRSKEGKTYGIQSDFQYEDNNGTFIVNTQVRSEITFQTINSFEALLKSFHECGITEEQLAIAKTQLKNAYFSIETPDDFADFVNPLLYPDYNRRKAVTDDIDKVDMKLVARIIKKYFSHAGFKLIIVGNEEVFPQLSTIKNLKRLSVRDLELPENKQ